MKIDSGRMLNDYIQPNKKQYCIDELIYNNLSDKHMTAKVFEDLIKKSSRFGVDKIMIDKAGKADSRTIERATSLVNAE